MNSNKKNIFIWILIPLTFIVGINILLYKKPSVKKKEVTFHYENPELIFFKNLRAFFYQPENKDHIEIHTLKELQKIKPAPPFYYAIVIDPQNSKSFISPKITVDQDSVLLTRSHQNIIDSLYIFEGSIIERYQQAATMYDWVREAEEIHIWDHQKQELLSKKAKDAYRKTLKDYFKLINAIH